MCFLCAYYYFWWLHPWHVEVPGPGIEPAPQQWLEPLRWQCLFLNLLPTRILCQPSFLSLFLFFCFFFGGGACMPTAYGSSWARDQTQTTALIWAAAVTTLDPYPAEPEKNLSLHSFSDSAKLISPSSPYSGLFPTLNLCSLLITHGVFGFFLRDSLEPISSWYAESLNFLPVHTWSS